MHRLAISSSAAILSAMLILVVGCEDPTKNKPAATVGSVITATSTSAKPAPIASVASAAPTVSASASAVASAALAPGAVKYTVAADSSKVGFIGSKITGKHEGSFEKFTGTIELTNGKPESAKVSIDIDIASVKTDQDKLITHLKSKDFFDVEHFPKATFVSTSIVASTTPGSTHTVTGDFELHGVKRAISFPATITVTGDTASATAEFSINRKDFGVVYPGKPDDLIKDGVLIKLAIKGIKAS
ncbi:MAG: YceI family protein [Polyangiales bacterium]